MEKRPAVMSDDLDEKSRAARARATMTPSTITTRNGVVYSGTKPVGRSRSRSSSVAPKSCADAASPFVHMVC